MNLQRQVCMITGAASGIGHAIAAGFEQRGAFVVATDCYHLQDIGVMQLIWDVSDPERADAVMQEVLERFGRIDVLVANAGIMPRQGWHSIDHSDWRRVQAVNLDGAWYGAQAAGKVMQTQGEGRIIFVSSVEVCLGVPEHCHYVTAKAGLVGLTRSLARALGPHGIRVNCLMPGAVQTDSELDQFPDQTALAAELAVRQCLPGRIQVDDLEPVAAFLASPLSRAITGQIICVDHGLIHY